MGLRDTQALFWRAITWPTGVESFLEQADPATRASFEQTFRSTAAFGRVERMGVYAEAFFWRLYDVLLDGYPALAFSMGEVDFRNLITDYVLDCPPDAPALRKLGDRLVDFVARHRLSADRPWLVEVARLDYWRYALLDVPDQPVVTAAELGRHAIAAWPSLRFRPGPMKVLGGHYDVAAVWEQSRQEGAHATPPAGGPQAQFHQLVWRKGFAVVHRTLAAAEAGALETLDRGGSFHEITAHLEPNEDGHADPAQVVAWLQGWLAAGLIAEVIADD
jgi:hypothetical protein